MFGGSDPSVPNLVPADITVADNYVTKPLSWRTERWSAKNLIELKNARRVIIARNLFENNWEGGQPGFAIVFTVRNQDGKCPWCQVDHVTFEQNVVRHSAAGIKILGWDNNHPSQQTQAILIRNNLLYDIDSKVWGGSGYFVAMTDGARDITVDHNTVRSGARLGNRPDRRPAGARVRLHQQPVHATAVTASPAPDTAPATAPSARTCRARTSRATSLPGHRPRAIRPATAFLPPRSSRPSSSPLNGGDYRLIASSPWRGAGTDGQDLGAPLGAALR